MIKLENVTKSYSPEVAALRDASFDVAKAEFVFLVGPSGSGKSTLLRLMNRQEKPEQGEVWVAGRNINDMPDAKVPQLRRNIGNVFQDYKLLLEQDRVRERRVRARGDRPAEARHPPAGPGGARPRRSRRQGGALSPPAQRWRAAARLDRHGRSSTGR